jgi:hypothetical protein
MCDTSKILFAIFLPHHNHYVYPSLSDNRSTFLELVVLRIKGGREERRDIKRRKERNSEMPDNTVIILV